MLVSLQQATPELALEATQQFAPPAKRMQQERMLKASQLAEPRLISERPRVLEEPERPNPLERLVMSPLLAWRSGPQALVSFAPIQPQSIPLRD